MIANGGALRTVLHRRTRYAPCLVAAALVASPAAGAGQVAGLGGGAGAGTIRQHNPIFGLGPQTIWKGGFGLEIQGEVARWKGRADEELLALHAEIMYGLTRDLTLTAAMPIVQRKSVSGLVPGTGQVSRDATGVGDAMIGAKWRIFHRFSGPTQYHAALLGGVKLPLGSRATEPPLGSGSTDFIGGATASRDGLRYYLWTSALVKLNGEASDRRRGNEFRYDAAGGIRPWIPSYTGFDLLLLVEFNGVTAARNVVHGVVQPGTGGTILAFSPGFWLTHRNLALKAGVKLPFYQALGTDEAELDFTTVLAFEFHI